MTHPEDKRPTSTLTESQAQVGLLLKISKYSKEEITLLQKIEQNTKTTAKATNGIYTIVLVQLIASIILGILVGMMSG